MKTTVSRSVLKVFTVAAGVQDLGCRVSGSSGFRVHLMPRSQWLADQRHGLCNFAPRGKGALKLLRSRGFREF